MLMYSRGRRVYEMAPSANNVMIAITVVIGRLIASAGNDRFTSVQLPVCPRMCRMAVFG